jgi:hypothetical protein
VPRLDGRCAEYENKIVCAATKGRSLVWSKIAAQSEAPRAVYGGQIVQIGTAHERGRVDRKTYAGGRRCRLEMQARVLIGV